MPFSIEYLNDRKGVVTTYWGTVTDKDISQSSQEKQENRDTISSYLYALTDLSQVKEFNVSSDSIRENARLSSQFLDTNRKMVVIFVFPTSLEYGMGRMWQAYADDNAERTHLFKTRAEADKWLDDNVKVT